VFATVLAGCHGGLHAQVVMAGLEFPSAFTLDPTDPDLIWYVERFTGEVRRRDLSNNQDTLVWTVRNVASGGDQGMLGIALHPSYSSSPFVYVFASRNHGIPSPRNQILRITLSGGVGVGQQAIFNTRRSVGSTPAAASSSDLAVCCSPPSETTATPPTRRTRAASRARSCA
jgi:hypothetical protein